MKTFEFGYDSTTVEQARAVVINPESRKKTADARHEQARLDEAISLTEAIQLDVAHAETVRLSKLHPGRYFGSGVTKRIGDEIALHNAELAVVNTSLTPVQQRNLESDWNCKVIDRTGLILEIFGARARTHEGVLQVELAALSYQRSRLVRSWTHLERQRGGAGFMGGPGERQIELDRRLIDQRIVKLKRELEQVKRTRSLHRSARKKVPTPVVALVGYTNAGKSTLFNKLTGETVMAKDMLFATLDPTMREIKLPSGRSVILSDTVGFISDLPTSLVAAFQATLEEVLEADVVAHVRDISHEDTDKQKSDVETVLSEIGFDMDDRPMIEVLNKIDLLPADERHTIQQRSGRNESQVALSALTGEGCGKFLSSVDNRLVTTQQIYDLTVDVRDGAAIAWLYANGEVRDRTDQGQEVHMSVLLDDAEIARFRQKFPKCNKAVAIG